MASCCRSAALHGCSMSNNVSTTTARSPWLQSSSFRPLSSPTRIKKNSARAVLMANPAPSIPNLDPFAPQFTDGSAYFNNSFINIEEKQQQSSANETFTSENLDGWLRESIHEIVGNIGEAPFLVHVFSGSGRVKLEREAATAEMWSRIKKRWDGDNDNSCKSPDGIVLVQELKDEDEDEDEGDNDNSLWGLVVQGRGAAAACYILDTCRVRSSLGFCTHFFLMKAQCFGEPTEVQVRKAWLQQERRR